MPMSPETGTRTDDRLVTVISRWLAGHVSDEELRQELEQAGPGELAADQAEAVEELRAELDAGRRRAELEMVARETLEALALGG
jgi:DNA-binding IclR family transcriptional regulator